MFKNNDGHLQDDLFNHYHSMRPSVAKLLDKTWAPIFYEQVFCKINEDLFAPMYSLDTGRPNTPVNILMSLEIFKHMFGYSDQEHGTNHSKLLLISNSFITALRLFFIGIGLNSKWWSFAKALTSSEIS